MASILHDSKIIFRFYIDLKETHTTWIQNEPCAMSFRFISQIKMA